MNVPADTTTSCRNLGLDGGGAKGFYTLGVLRQLEALLGNSRSTLNSI
jgi:predicted acylesterase/phospholipase RssA